MKNILTFIILVALSIGSCKPKKTFVVGSSSSGVNTSRSNIKNNIEEKDTTKTEKKKDFIEVR
jgi:hypothetical protein